MNNEHENHEHNQASTMVTPPPFRPTASPTLADKIAALELDEEVSSQLINLTANLDPEHVTTDMLDTLARGVTHATDVQNADAAGYLRGRNEKIEAVLQPEPEDDDQIVQATPVFPRYCRRSIWDV